MRIVFAALAFALLAACGQSASAPAPAAEAPAAARAPAGLTVSNPWAAVTPGGATVAAGYMTITNNANEADRLLTIMSPRAQRVEAHEMEMHGDVMQMQAVEGGLIIPANGVVHLEPGGLHLMFHDIDAPFAIGESVPLTLTFENAGEVTTLLPVRTPQAASATPAQPPAH